MSRDDLDALFQQLDDPSGIAWNEETYDLARARSLDASERAAFVARLLKLVDEGDARAMLTLGELAATEAIDPLLRVSSQQGAAAPIARRALVELGRGASIASGIAQDATTDANPSVRATAIINLGRIGGPNAAAALEACLDDADSTIRQLAVDSLIAALGLQKYTKDANGARELRTPLERMKLLIGSDLGSLVKIGAAELRDAIRAIQSGKTPEQAGLGWSPAMPTQLRAAMPPALVDESAPLPIDDLAKVAGADRKWAEALIAVGLQRQDPRIPEALAKLDATWTLPALDELATSASGAFGQAVDAARRTLGGSAN